jgi:hypothetical protein
MHIFLKSKQDSNIPGIRKPPLAPRQAVAISLGGLALGVVAVILACMLFLVPLWQAIACYAVGAFFVLAFPWACLQWETRNRAVRAHNRFVYFIIGILVVALVTQRGIKGGKPFPMWGIGLIICAGVAAYSVMAFYAIENFRKWRRGDFRGIDEKRT